MRRDHLTLLPPELIEALRQPMPFEDRRELVRAMVSEQLIRLQALRHVEEQRRGEQAEQAGDWERLDRSGTDH